MRIPYFAVVTAAAVLAAGCGSGGAVVYCEVEASADLRACIAGLTEATLNCFALDGERCAPDDANGVATLAALESAIEAQCIDAAPLDEPDFLTHRSPESWIARFTRACQAEAESLEARTFGGLHSAAWAEADTESRACLALAHAQAAEIIDEVLVLHSECIGDAAACDVEALEQTAATVASNVATAIGATCDLEALIAVDSEEYAARALAQADCLTATAFVDPSPLSLDCGPTTVGATLPRGEYAQVVLDQEIYGTRCGNGSDYAFQVRLAPEGEPLDRVLIALEGGGVCLFEDDCRNRLENSPDLFEALSDEADETGIMSNDPEVSPFANWTKVFFPYCTQDVFIGGGVPQVFDDNEPAFTVERYGAPNTRAALRYMRDLLWGLLDESDHEGYRSDRLTVLFGGFSAGSFGALYNYHYVLDDLQWAHTAAFPDAGFALDNGQPLGIVALGGILIAGTWFAQPFLPPYCFADVCAAGPTLLEATSPRLKAVPEQQILMLSNQNDLTQVQTTFFADTPAWINTLRSAYCDTKDLKGVSYYLTSETESVHVVSPREEFYTGSVDGISMRDWLEQAIVDPDTLEDRAEEGAFVTDIAGVEPFPCNVAP